jgi:hypothetical protein
MFKPPSKVAQPELQLLGFHLLFTAYSLLPNSGFMDKGQKVEEAVTLKDKKKNNVGLQSTEHIQQPRVISGLEDTYVTMG